MSRSDALRVLPRRPAAPRPLSVRRRWAVPVGVAAAIGLGVTASLVGPRLVAAAGPDLAPRTAASLVAAATAATGRPLSGTVRQVLDLGLPTLPGAGLSDGLATGTGTTATTATGPRTASVWQRSPTEQRLAVLGTLSEVDVLRRGRDQWVWDSSADTVRHTVIATDATGPAGSGGPGGLAALDAVVGTGGTDATPGGILTPPQAAALLLHVAGAAAGSVLAEPVRVAGRPAYELVVTPAGAGTLVGRVVVDVDAVTSVPLRVRVYARGSQTPAFSTQFSAVRFRTPDAALLAFSAPAGAVTTSGAAAPAAGAVRVVGAGWTSVATTPATADGATTGTAGTAALARLLGAPAQLSALLSGATAVRGPFGTGRLLRAPLFTALVLTDGRVLAGAVTPAVLERAASR